MDGGSLLLLVRAAGVSLLLAVAAVVSGTGLGIALAGLAFSGLSIVRAIYRAWVYVVRGMPVLVLALLVFYALPAMDLQTGPYVAGVMVLAIYVGALFAEVFRGGVLAIPRAQWESAKSLGLPPWAMLGKVVIPLVARYTLAPYVNVCVMTVKASSVLSIIGVWELTFAAREIIERTLAVVTVLGAAGALYFLICFGIDRTGRWLERRLMARGFVGEPA